MPSSNLTRKIRRYRKALGEELNGYLREVSAYALNDILENSPVKSGRYKASNRVSINGEDNSFEGPDYSGGGIRGEGLQTGDSRSDIINEAVWGDTVVISNNVPYAELIESGYSNQAPEGVYQNAIERTRLFAEEEAKGAIDVS